MTAPCKPADGRGSSGGYRRLHTNISLSAQAQPTSTPRTPAPLGPLRMACPDDHLEETVVRSQKGSQRGSSDAF